MVQRIGRYEYEDTSEIGRGGFGAVYRGHDPSYLDRTVAIKILSSHDDAVTVARFKVEAKAVGGLHHENIVVVHDSGVDSGKPYLVMEYLDGTDLRHVIANRAEFEALTLLERVEIMADAAQGLQYAHTKGVLHRDVKPANIMRLRNGSVKILDFGIARLTGTSETRLTWTGSIPGSLPYMAPELFGPRADFDALCDIWSYGVVFYELLTGVHPFPGVNPGQTLNLILHEEPPSLASLVPDCPAALQTHMLHLLSKDRGHRTQSLDDLLLDIESVIRSLARVEIPALIGQTEGMIDANDERAGFVIERIRRLDPSNKDIRRLRERARLRPKISVLLREVEDYTDKRDFVAAREKLDSAILLDPSSSTLRNWAVRVQEGEERAQRATVCIVQGRSAFKEGDLTGAYACFSEGLETDPGNQECSSQIEAVKRAMQEREVRAHIRAVMAEANSLILIEAYVDAITLLSDLAEKTSNDEQVVRRLDEVRQLRQAQVAKEQLDAGINSARDLLKRANHQQACQVLEELEREYPASPAIEVLLAHARERLRAEKIASEIEMLLAQARGHRASERFEQALELINRALELDNTSSKALALQGICLKEAQADRDHRRIEAELQQFQNFLAAEELEDALDLANRLTSDHPREVRVAEARSQVEARIRERDELKKREIHKGIDEAERLLAEGQADSATRLLNGLTEQAPADTTVRDLLDRAQQLKLAQETWKAQNRLNEGLNSVRELLRSARFEDACRMLEDLDRQNPANPAIEVMRESVREKQLAAKIEKLLEDARRHHASGEFTRALELVHAALEVDPANNISLTLQGTILAGQQAAEDSRKIAEGLAHVHALEKDRQFDQALAEIERLVRDYPRDSGVLELRNRVAASVRDRDKDFQDWLAAGLNSAKELLNTRHFEQACVALEKLDRLSPNNPAVEVLLAHARERLTAERLVAQVDGLLAEARAQQTEGQLEKALGLVGRALELDPGNPRIAAARSDVATRISERDKLRGRGVQEGCREAERLLSAELVDQALKLLVDLAEQHGEDTGIGELLERARRLKREKEVRKEIQENILTARRSAAKREWDKALSIIEMGRKKHPDCRDYIDEAENIGGLRNRDLELSAVEAALNTSPLEQVVTRAQGALVRYPEDPRAMAVLQRAQSLVELKRLIVYLRRRLTNGDLDEARQLLADGKLRFPDSAELREIENEIGTAKGFDLSVRNARTALQNRDFADARNVVNALLAVRPGSADARQLLADIDAQQKEYERQQEYDVGREEVDRLIRSRAFSQAIENAERLIAAFPGDQALLGHLDRVRTARDEHARREAFARTRSEALSLSDQGFPDQAIGKIESLLLDFHGDPTLMADLETVRAAKRLREERSRIDARVAELDALFRNGDVEAVRRGAKELFKDHKDPRVSALLDLAERSIAKAEEIRRVGKTRRPILLWGGIACCLTALTFAIVLLWPPHRFTPDGRVGVKKTASDPAQFRSPEESAEKATFSRQPEINLKPQTMEFSWLRGDPEPQPQTLHVGTNIQNQEWTIVTHDPWLRVSDGRHFGSREPLVSVSASGLATGKHESFATVGQAKLTVHLLVTDPRPGGATGGSGATGSAGAPVLPRAFVDCHAKNYTGPKNGTIEWVGNLGSNEELRISGRDALASTGSVERGKIPGCPVDATVTVDPASSQTLINQSWSDDFSSFHLINRSSQAIRSIKIAWRIK